MLLKDDSESMIDGDEGRVLPCWRARLVPDYDLGLILPGHIPVPVWQLDPPPRSKYEFSGCFVYVLRP